MSKKLLGLTIAAAAALTFSAVPMTSAFADDAAASTDQAKTMPADDGKGNEVKCFGANSCKGKSECKTAKNSCKGQNSCKGKGVMKMDSEKACTDAGGKTTE